MALSTYDPAQVAVIVNGFTMGGFADGTFVLVERDEDAWSLTVGTDGEATRSKSNNRSGTITITLLNSSDSNTVLDGFANSDEVSNAGVVTVFIKDNSGTTLATAEQAWVQRKASTEFAREATEREWVLRTGELILSPGGN